MGNIESAVAHAAVSVVGAVTGAKQISLEDRSPGLKTRLLEIANIKAKGTLTVNDYTRMSEIEIEIDRLKILVKKKEDGSITDDQQEELDAFISDKYDEWKEKHPTDNSEEPRWIFPEHAPAQVFNLHVRPVDHIAARLRPVDDKKNNIGSSLARDLGM
jgi:hypothetical protein